MESFDNFIERLGSSSPAPGGGAASAMVSIVSASLASMVASLTVGKKKYMEYEEEMKGILQSSEDLKNDLRQLMKDDEDAFNEIMAAYKMPKESDEEKKLRKEKLTGAAKGAIKVPWQIAGKSRDILTLSLKLSEHGNRNAITDAACAAIFAFGAIKGVLYNVRVNLTSLEDKDYVESEKMKMKFFLEDAEAVYNKVIENVDRAI